MVAIIRMFDIVLAVLGLTILSPLMLILWVLTLFDTGSPLFRQQRVGRLQKPFILYKFRSMRKDTASVATHLVDANAVTPLGKFLRNSKLDELPQLWNVCKGDMSLVGPRPCLLNQDEVIKERIKRNIFQVRPGMTGLAQILAIDTSTPVLLADTEAQMLSTLTLLSYFRYILLTLSGKGRGDRIVPPR